MSRGDLHSEFKVEEGEPGPFSVGAGTDAMYIHRLPCEQTE